MERVNEGDQPWAWVFDEKVACTACDNQVDPFGVWHYHPKLNVIQCGDCNKMYRKGNVHNHYSMLQNGNVNSIYTVVLLS